MSESDITLLHAWERCGRNDVRAGRKPYVTQALARTLTPLGIACVIAYCRGREDELASQAWPPTVPASS